jgi:hypothetical protein
MTARAGRGEVSESGELAAIYGLDVIQALRQGLCLLVQAQLPGQSDGFAKRILRFTVVPGGTGVRPRFVKLVVGVFARPNALVHPFEFVVYLFFLHITSRTEFIMRQIRLRDKRE